jgi:hypothetical protein
MKVGTRYWNDGSMEVQIKQVTNKMKKKVTQRDQIMFLFERTT